MFTISMKLDLSTLVENQSAPYIYDHILTPIPRVSMTLAIIVGTGGKIKMTILVLCVKNVFIIKINIYYYNYIIFIYSFSGNKLIFHHLSIFFKTVIKY